MCNTFFLVQVVHGTGHGEASHPYLLTDDFMEALSGVSEVMSEGSGYLSKFTSMDHGVSIMKLREYKRIPRDAYKFIGDQPSPQFPGLVYFSFDRATRSLKQDWFVVDPARLWILAARLAGLRPGTALVEGRWIMARKRNGEWLGVRDSCDEYVPCACEAFISAVAQASEWQDRLGVLPKPEVRVIPDDMDEFEWLIKAIGHEI